MSATQAPQVDRDALVVESAQHARGHDWRRWVLQPLVVLVAAALVVAYASSGMPASDAARTLNPGNLLVLTGQHALLTIVPTVIVLVVALPLGVLLTRRRTRAAAPVVVAFANMGQAAPAVGLIVLLALWIGAGVWAAIFALALYAILPVLRNTITGLQQVDQRLVEAGRGMGMSAMSVLFRIELPLAVPIILAGIRVALVLLVGTAALATFVDGGGLGLLIQSGIQLGTNDVLLCGAVLVSGLALLVDWAGQVVEDIARPRGV